MLGELAHGNGVLALAIESNLALQAYGTPTVGPVYAPAPDFVPPAASITR